MHIGAENMSAQKMGKSRNTPGLTGIICTSDYWGGPDAHEIFVHGVVPPEFVIGLVHVFQSGNSRSIKHSPQCHFIKHML